MCPIGDWRVLANSRHMDLGGASSQACAFSVHSEATHRLFSRYPLPRLSQCSFKATWSQGSLSCLCVVLQMTGSRTSWRWNLLSYRHPGWVRSAVSCVCAVWQSAAPGIILAVLSTGSLRTKQVKLDFPKSPHWLLLDSACNENKLRLSFYFINPESHWDCHRFEISSA